jgi:hypothetical protein
VAKYDGPLPQHYTKNAESAYQPQDDEDDNDLDFDDGWDDDDLGLDSDDQSEKISVITVQVGDKSHKFVRDSKGRFAKQG